MHELSLCFSIVESVTDLAKKDNFNIVESISLEIGKMSGVEKDSIEFCFPEAAKESVLEGAKLIIQEVPITIFCKDCKKESYPDKYELQCGHCNKHNIEIIGGKEFKIKSLEVE